MEFETHMEDANGDRWVFWVDVDAPENPEPQSAPMAINIRPWYPAWLVKLVVSWALWRSE